MYIISFLPIKGAKVNYVIFSLFNLVVLNFLAFVTSIYLKCDILQLLFLGSFFIVIFILLYICNTITFSVVTHLVTAIILLVLYFYKTTLYIFNINFNSIFKLVNFGYTHNGIKLNCIPPTTILYYVKLGELYSQFIYHSRLNYIHYSLLLVDNLNYINNSSYYSANIIIQQTINVCYPITQNIYYSHCSIIGLQSSLYCNILNTYMLILSFTASFAVYIYYYFLIS